MARLKSCPFYGKNETGESMSFNAEVSVDSDGMFAIVIPEELAEAAQGLARTRTELPRVIVTRPRTNWRVESTDLESAERFVREAIAAHLAVEVTRERVICYTHEARYTVWQNADGTLEPSGSWGDYYEKVRGQWHGPLNATTNDAAYRIGFVARVFDRVTYRRPSHCKVELLAPERDEGTTHWTLNPMNRLNGFVGLAQFKPTEHTPSMPYSDEAAEFFADMMLSMCKLALRLEDFLADGERLQLAIQNRVPLLGGPERLAESEQA